MAAPIENLTKDSYDLQFGTNVLGHFHLTSLLLPALLKSPAPRVINVSSIGHRYPQSGGIKFETLKGPKKGTWIPILAFSERYAYYGQSKLVRDSLLAELPILLGAYRETFFMLMS